MQRARFRRLVQAAVDSIPEEFAERMENVEILVRTHPTAEERADAEVGPNGLLLGLYVGQPLTHRGSYYGNTLPDRIMIYQDAIETISRSETEVTKQVGKTVLHEIAHHFGIDDERLEELGV
jgi:predicted Zn-dependent protease with MMP-like domain